MRGWWTDAAYPNSSRWFWPSSVLSGAVPTATSTANCRREFAYTNATRGRGPGELLGAGAGRRLELRRVNSGTWLLLCRVATADLVDAFL